MVVIRKTKKKLVIWEFLKRLRNWIYKWSFLKVVLGRDCLVFVFSPSLKWHCCVMHKMFLSILKTKLHYHLSNAITFEIMNSFRFLQLQSYLFNLWFLKQIQESLKLVLAKRYFITFKKKLKPWIASFIWVLWGLNEFNEY